MTATTKRRRRPHVYQELPLQIKTVRLPFWHIRQANKIGEGNFSEGIRLALELYDQNNKE